MQANIRRQLSKKLGTPKRLHKGKPQAIKQASKSKSRRKGRSGRRRKKRNTDRYRKARLDAALGCFQFEKRYPDERTVDNTAIDARWPDGGVTCPRPGCGSADVVEVRRRKHRTWRCRECGRRFHALTCTTLQGIHGSWRTIPLAIYWCLQYPYNSALTLASALKTDERTIVHKTALRVEHKIFAAMDGILLPPLGGYCQMDDTLIGHVDGVPIAVMGIVSEGTGHLKVQEVCGEVNHENSGPFIENSTEPDAILITDDTNDFPFGIRIRLTVNHSKPLSEPGPRYAEWYETYRKLVTTNKIENFWRILKMLLWAHRAFTSRHLHLYVNAAVWHASHLMEPIEDQMKALIRNSHAVWVRAATAEDDTPLEFQLGIQQVRRSNQHKLDSELAVARPCKDQLPIPGLEHLLVA